MTSGIFLEFDARNHAMGNLLGLRATLVLPMARVRLLRLQKQGAKIVLPNCACHLAQIGPDLYSKCGCASPSNFLYKMGWVVRKITWSSTS